MFYFYAIIQSFNMKPSLERLPLEQGESFVAKFFDYSFYPTPWHYHPEYEIVLVTESPENVLLVIIFLILNRVTLHY